MRLSITPVSERLQQQLAEPRTLASLAGVLAALALALAVVGLYGVTAFVVGQRSQEISVRSRSAQPAATSCACSCTTACDRSLFGLAAGVFVALLAEPRLRRRPLRRQHRRTRLPSAPRCWSSSAPRRSQSSFPTRGAAAVDPAAVLRQL